MNGFLLYNWNRSKVYDSYLATELMMNNLARNLSNIPNSFFIGQDFSYRQYYLHMSVSNIFNLRNGFFSLTIIGKAFSKFIEP